MRASSTITGKSINTIIKTPNTPTELLNISTLEARVPRVVATVPPDSGIKLLAANFAPFIAILSARDAIIVCAANELVNITIINEIALIYHFLTDAPIASPAVIPPPIVERSVRDRHTQNTGITVFVNTSWQTVNIAVKVALEVAATVKFPPMAYSVAESGINDATAEKSLSK